MQNYTRILIASIILLMFGTVFMASSQGWWHYGFRNAGVMNKNLEENKQYRQYYGSGSGTGFRTGSSTRSFRSGTRGGRGK